MAALIVACLPFTFVDDSSGTVEQSDGVMHVLALLVRIVQLFKVHVIEGSINCCLFTLYICR